MAPTTTAPTPAQIHRARSLTDAAPPVGENLNFVRPGERTSIDAMGGKIENFVSREAEEFSAVQHELRIGVPVRRSWESPEDFAARRANGAQAPAPPQLVMDPQKARGELDKLERYYRLHPISRKGSAKLVERATQDFARMNQLRGILNLEEHDYFAAAVPASLADQVAAAFAAFQKTPEPEGRIGAVRASHDVNLLKIVAFHDTDDRVRAAAESRYAELTAPANV